MLPVSVIIVLSVCAVEILANCPTPNNDDPIENCCNLRIPAEEFTFGEVAATSESNVYKLKNFCDKNCTSLVINGYCDTVTDGGGWLVIQRRTNGSENFHRDWDDYEKGFGSLTGELWYGLRAIHCLTRYGDWELRIDFTFSYGTKSFMHYHHFKVGPADDNYRLNISGFTGVTPSDPFTLHELNGQPFSTYDRLNHGSCAVFAHGSKAPGGWWHNNCFYINLNYNYGAPNGFISFDRKIWHTPTYIEMKIRPKGCKIN